MNNELTKHCILYGVQYILILDECDNSRTCTAQAQGHQQNCVATNYLTAKTN